MPDPGPGGAAGLHVGPPRHRLAGRGERTPPREIRLALEFAVRHPEDIDQRIERHEAAIQASQHAAEQRQAYRAEHVSEVGLAGATDDQVAAFACVSTAVVVTENVADFSQMEELIVVFVRKRHLPAGGAQGAALAALVRRWASEHRRPCIGHHWPT